MFGINDFICFTNQNLILHFICTFKKVECEILIKKSNFFFDEIIKFKRFYGN